MEERNHFAELVQLIEEYEEKRDSFDPKQLIDMRERISLTMFYLSDTISMTYAVFEKASYDRKRNYSDNIIEITGGVDDKGKKIGVTLASEMARVANKEFEEKEVEAMRMKDRARIVLDATKQILNAISSRVSNVKPSY